MAISGTDDTALPTGLAHTMAAFPEVEGGDSATRWS